MQEQNKKMEKQQILHDANAKSTCDSHANKINVKVVGSINRPLRIASRRFSAQLLRVRSWVARARALMQIRVHPIDQALKRHTHTDKKVQ